MPILFCITWVEKAILLPWARGGRVRVVYRVGLREELPGSHCAHSMVSSVYQGNCWVSAGWATKCSAEKPQKQVPKLQEEPRLLTKVPRSSKHRRRHSRLQGRRVSVARSSIRC